MRMYRILSAALLATTLSGEASLAGQRQTKTVLVIPSRYRVVQFAMDIAHLRPTYVVAYGTRSSPTDLAFYLWSAQAQEWKDISAEEYSTGSILDASAQSLVLVGSEKDLPADLRTQPAWATKTVRIESLNPAEMANALDGSMQFTPGEWRWLAKRYGMTITDLNAERRRYGKYGPPGSNVKPTRQEAAVEPPLTPLLPAEQQGKSEALPVEPEEPKFDVAPSPAPVPRRPTALRMIEAGAAPAPAPAVVPTPKKPEDK